MPLTNRSMNEVTRSNLTVKLSKNTNQAQNRRSSMRIWRSIYTVTFSFSLVSTLNLGSSTGLIWLAQLYRINGFSIRFGPASVSNTAATGSITDGLAPIETRTLYLHFWNKNNFTSSGTKSFYGSMFLTEKPTFSTYLLRDSYKQFGFRAYSWWLIYHLSPYHPLQ